jgi:hypothetical protein
MSKKYIQDNILLTKEAFAEYILKQREAEAARYGLTLEQYRQIIMNGGIVVQQLPTSSIPPNISNFL